MKVALPNKGILQPPTMELLASCGYNVGQAGGLSWQDTENEVEFYFLRPRDIPLYVANGVLDAGVTGRDFVEEKGVELAMLLDLNFGQSRLCVAVPQDSPAKTLADVARLRIATSLPEITRRALGGADLDLVPLEGAVEISVRLGIADAVVDTVDTGQTLAEAGLRVIGEPLFRSNAALYAHAGRATMSQVVTMKSRLEGRLVAQEYLMAEYDCPAAILPEACRITPGIESPTIAPLQTEGWYSVKAMVRRSEANRILDELSAIGCKGILLTKIETARI